MKGIYLDHAATTPISSAVLEEMMPYLKGNFGNPSSIHQLGQTSKQAIDEARERVARFLNCFPNEIIFTGSATESDNMAILGIANFYLKKNKKVHIITTKIEHPSVLESCRALEKRGCEVDYCAVSKKGIVNVSDIEKLIKDNTVLVSVMYANNEIGAIEPIAEIGEIIKKANSIQNSKFPILFHTDAVQAVNYLNCDIQYLGVDMLTMSAHKIYGPKGVGVLYMKQGVEIEPIIYGGGQERDLRSGTENVPLIVGLGSAVYEVENNKDKSEKIQKLRDKLINGISEKISDTKLNGPRENRLPNNANFSFQGAEGEAIVIALDQEGIAASTGSACSAKELQASHVLLALGLSKEQAHGSLRLTLGKDTTEQEIDRVLEVLPKIIERLRKISGF